MHTIDVLAHPWLQIMINQVEIGDSICTGRIECHIMQLMHNPAGYQATKAENQLIQNNLNHLH